MLTTLYNFMKINNMRFLSLIFGLVLFLLSGNMLFADGLGLITDEENNFWMFHDGNFTRLEHNLVKQHYVGHNYFAYIDYLGNMKVWHNNQLQTISVSVNEFKATEHFIYWSVAGFLFVWHDGVKTEISRETTFAKAKGNILFFEDAFENALRIYYNHQVFTFARNFYSIRTQALSVGRSSVAVLDGGEQLFVFDRGEMQVKSYSTDKILFSAGGSGVLVKNEDSKYLELIVGQNVEVLDYFEPRFFKTDYNWLVWEEQSGNVNYWDGYQKQLITYQRPSVLEFSPNSLLYENGGQLYLFTQQADRRVCEYIPKAYSFYNDLFVFANPQQQIEINDDGNVSILSSIPGTSFKQYFDVIVISEGRRRSVYYQGKIYRL